MLRPEIKVLYVCGYTDDDALRRDILSEEGVFLQKPFTRGSQAATQDGSQTEE